jgi:hypothetical protein
VAALVVLLADVAAHPSITLSGLATSKAAKAGQVKRDPCAGRRITASQAKSFIDRTWDPDRWQRKGGEPKPATIVAYRHRLKCAAGLGHRRAIRDHWRRDKRAFYRHRSYKLRWGDCSDAGPVSDCIHGAALTYGADEGWMLRVSYCESTWNRFAVNGSSGSSGLFQFIFSTWRTTPYGERSIWSVRWQSLAAAWMWKQGRSGEWVCE